MVRENQVREMIEGAGGRIEEVGDLPDGSGFATASFPLRKDHWLYADGHEPPPMPMRMGTDDPRRHQFNEMVRAAAQYAVRAATMNGKESDFDPDALVQCMVVGLLGYHTSDGTSQLEDWMNPKPLPEAFP